MTNNTEANTAVITHTKSFGNTLKFTGKHTMLLENTVTELC